MVSTLVVGIDAATFRRIDPLLESGDLPRVATIREAGTGGTLESTLPPMTPQAWTTIATGVDPGAHGVLDFRTQETDGYRIQPVDYAKMERPTIWDLLSTDGTSVGVVNYPLAYPPHEAPEFFVSGIPAAEDEDIAHPDSAGAVLADHDYRVKPAVSHEESDIDYYHELEALATKRCDVSLELANQFDPDLLWTVFMSIDWAQHYLWGREIDGEDAVDRMYRHIDAQLDRLVSELSPDRVLLLSDHGAQRLSGELHLNTLLRQWGYLVHSSDRESRSAKLRRDLLSAVHRAGQAVPFGLRQRLKSILPERFVSETRSAADAGQSRMHESIIWEETRAFSYGSMGRIFVHSADRYPEGVVSAEEYKQLRTELERRLQSLRAPGRDEPIIEEVYKGEELYSDDYADSVPDLVFSTTDWRYMAYGNFGEAPVHEPRHRRADHDRSGVFLAAGDRFADGELTSPIEAADVAPTLLHLHGAPVASSMSGRVRIDALAGTPTARSPEYAEATDISHSRVSNSNTGSIEERLEDLGYL